MELSTCDGYLESFWLIKWLELCVGTTFSTRRPQHTALHRAARSFPLGMLLENWLAVHISRKSMMGSLGKSH